MDSDDLSLLNTTLFALSEKTRDTPPSEVESPSLFLLSSIEPSDQPHISTSVTSQQKGSAKRKKAKKEETSLSDEQLERLTDFIRKNVDSEDKTNKPIFKFSREPIKSYTDFVKKLMDHEMEIASLEDVLIFGENKSFVPEEREKNLVKEFSTAMKTSILDTHDILTWFHQAVTPKPKKPKSDMVESQGLSEPRKKEKKGSDVEVVPRATSTLKKFCSQFNVTPDSVVEQLLKTMLVDEIMENLAIESKDFFRSEVELDIETIRKEMSLLAPQSCTDTALFNILTSLKKNLADTNQKNLILKALNGFIMDHAKVLSDDEVLVPVNKILLMSMRGASESELMRAVENIEQYARNKLDDHRKIQYEEKKKELLECIHSLPYSPETFASIDQFLRSLKE